MAVKFVFPTVQRGKEIYTNVPGRTFQSAKLRIFFDIIEWLREFGEFLLAPITFYPPEITGNSLQLILPLIGSSLLQNPINNW